MKQWSLIALSASALFALPFAAHAHIDETSANGAHASSHHSVAAEDRGHAAALGAPASLKDATVTVEVLMNDTMRFSPERITIKRGETVRFVVRNQGSAKHEMVLGTLAELKEHAALMRKFPSMEHEDPNAISVEPGKTGEFAWTFSKAGSFDFACLVPGHFEAGMKGRIIVKK